MPDDTFRAAGDVTLGHKLGLTDQWLRVWRVILFDENNVASMFGSAAVGEVVAESTGVVTGGGYSSQVPTGQEPGLETYAAGLRIHFTVTLATEQSPNVAEITLYNLGESESERLMKENTYVVLQAGYQYGFAGTIFTGSIKAFKKGHDTATDSYLKIYAGDGERGINRAQIAQTFPPGTDPKDQILAMGKTMEQYGVSLGNVEAAAIKTGANVRDEVRFGQTVDQFRDFGSANGAIWYVLDQRYNWILPTSYDPGDTVVLNSMTGMVGFPEMTADGINVTCLINPRIRLNRLIHLNNDEINQYYTFEPGTRKLVSGGNVQWPSFNITNYAPTAGSGIYKTMMISYEGDSRGGPWYQYMVCAAVDMSNSNPLLAALGMFDWNSIT